MNNILKIYQNRNTRKLSNPRWRLAPAWNEFNSDNLAIIQCIRTIFDTDTKMRTQNKFSCQNSYSTKFKMAAAVILKFTFTAIARLLLHIFVHIWCRGWKCSFGTRSTFFGGYGGEFFIYFLDNIAVFKVALVTVFFIISQTRLSLYCSDLTWL